MGQTLLGRGFAVAFISLSAVGQSLNKGALRMLGTLMAFVVSLAVIALFAQERWWFMVALSAWVGYCTYMNGGTRHQYFWFVAGFASVIICFDGGTNAANAFQTALLRAEETGLGILVYTLVTILVWPTGTRGELDKAASQLAATEHALYRCYRKLVRGEGTLEDADPLRMRQVQQFGQFSQALAAAKTDSYEVFEALTRSLFETIADIKGFGRASVQPNETAAPTAVFLPDPDRILSAVRAMGTLWLAYLVWIYVEVPGGSGFVMAIGSLGMTLASNPQIRASVLLQPALAYRMQELIEARQSPQAGLLVRELLADVRAWRVEVQGVFEHLCRDPAAKEADGMREGLTAILGHLEERIKETLNLAAEGELSDQDGERFYRLLGAYRGLSEAVIEYTGTAAEIDWSRWRESRF